MLRFMKGKPAEKAKVLEQIERQQQRTPPQSSGGQGSSQSQPDESVHDHDDKLAYALKEAAEARAVEIKLRQSLQLSATKLMQAEHLKTELHGASAHFRGRVVEWKWHDA